jgi:hypothetical protein
MLDSLGCLGLRFFWDIACRAGWAIGGIAVSFLTSARLAARNSSCTVCMGIPRDGRIETRRNLSNLEHGASRFHERLEATVGQSSNFSKRPGMGQSVGRSTVGARPEERLMKIMDWVVERSSESSGGI